MSSNLVTGFFYRLTESENYMFGVMAVAGQDYDNAIIGAFVVRGQDYKPAFDVASDWDVFEYTRLDGANERDRVFLEDVWARSESVEVDGEVRKVVGSSVFSSHHLRLI